MESKRTFWDIEPITTNKSSRNTIFNTFPYPENLQTIENVCFDKFGGVTGPPSCHFNVPGNSRNPLFSRRTEKPYFFALKTAAFLTAKTTVTATARDAAVVAFGHGLKTVK